MNIKYYLKQQLPKPNALVIKKDRYLKKIRALMEHGCDLKTQVNKISIIFSLRKAMSNCFTVKIC